MREGFKTIRAVKRVKCEKGIVFLLRKVQSSYKVLRVMWRTAVDDVEDDVVSTWRTACTGKTGRSRVRSKAVLGIGESKAESES